MAKHGFNEAERFLIKHWNGCVQLEESMASVRTKYQELCERAVDTFRSQHDEFDVSRVRVIQISGNQPGYIWVSKKRWPRSGKDPAGIWIENIRLEHVADEETRPPLSYFWIKPVEEQGISLEDSKKRLLAELSGTLSAEESARISKVPDKGYVVAFEFLDKQKLLECLADPNGGEFSDRLVEQFEVLARVAPAFDDLLAESSSKRR